MNTKERLFDALVAMKVLTSLVAMHMDREWRRQLFIQLDRLHDAEDWDEGDDPVTAESFKTYLRAMFQLKPIRRPGLGLANGGHLLGHWSNGQDRLTMEFMPGDAVRIVVVKYFDQNRESAAVATHVDRLRQVLQPYGPECWLGN